MHRHRAVVAPLLLGLALAPASAAVLHVSQSAPGPSHDGTSWTSAFTTVAAALGAAQPDDEVWVARGVYAETVILPSGVALYGGFAGTETERGQRRVTAHETVLDGLQANTVVSIPADATATTILDGFTIRNGSPAGVGCGSSSAPVVRGNTIHDSIGPGIGCVESNATIESNTLEDNGMGVSLTRAACTVRGNTIRRCSHDGVSIHGSLVGASSRILNNTIADSAESGINVYDGPVEIVGNRIERSKAEGIWIQPVMLSGHRYQPRIVANTIRASGDAAIWVSPFVNATIIGNAISAAMDGILTRGASHTIANNTITGCIRSGMRLGYDPGSADDPVANEDLVVNNIIAFNAMGVTLEEGVTITARNNVFHANDAWDDSPSIDLAAMPGNRDADPLLADAGHGDLHIQPGSPCRDTGEDLADLAGLEDVDGQPRIQGTHADIGADESDGTVPVVAVPIFYVRIDGSDGNDGTSWASAKRTVQAGVDAARLCNGDVWVSGGIYRERIVLAPFVHLSGGFVGNETTRPSGPPLTVSVLDAEMRGSVVTGRGGVAVNALDGFTITNGSAFSGGGLHCEGGITLSHLQITGCRAEQTGGGALLGAGLSRVQDCHIEGNSAKEGGGIALTGTATLERCSIVANSADQVGGGIFVEGTTLLRSSLLMRSNLLLRNQASFYGGAVRAEWAYVSLDNNTLVENTGSYSVVATVATQLRMVNNIVAYNAGSYSILAPKPGALRANCFFQNSPMRITDVTDPVGTDANIGADPLFANRTAGDYRLKRGSPCIDAGDDSVWSPGDRDLDGMNRRIGDHVDIGAYESRYNILSFSDLAFALKASGGLVTPSADDLGRLSVAYPLGSRGIHLHDVIQIARIASGLE